MFSLMICKNEILLVIYISSNAFNFENICRYSLWSVLFILKTIIPNYTSECIIKSPITLALSKCLIDVATSKIQKQWRFHKYMIFMKKCAFRNKIRNKEKFNQFIQN